MFFVTVIFSILGTNQSLHVVIHLGFLQNCIHLLSYRNILAKSNYQFFNTFYHYEEYCSSSIVAAVVVWRV